MKYFYLVDNEYDTSIIVAKNEKSARNIVSNAGLSVKQLYELKSYTFDKEGFLLTAERM